MRITFLIPNDNLSGGIRVIAIYAKLLQARGHQVMVVGNRPASISTREHLRALRHGRWRELQREVCASREPGHIALSGVRHRVLERHRPIVAGDVPDADVLVSTWWETALWMHAMPAAKGRKVHLIQGYEVWWGGPSDHARVHDALRLPNRKIAISTGLKRDIERELGDLGIDVVNNAVDRAQFNAPARARSRQPTVGFIYSNDPIKGADRYAKIIDRARRQIPELRVLAFGSQVPTADMPLPAETEFHYRPPQHALAGLYARCDAWLFASRIDSFGLPVLESMACRTPVVGVPIGAAPELLGDGCGTLVDAADEEALPSAMADALVGLLRQPAQTWRAMSERAHVRAHAYSWEDAVERFESLVAHPAAYAKHQRTGEPACAASEMMLASATA
jgi:glycosyltransferase involved in cell wall biosynthesis